MQGEEILIHYFLCNYIPQSKGSDKLSKSLLGFKQGLYPHKQAWIDCSYEELKGKSDLRQFLILRAFNSEEQTVSTDTKPLDELGTKLAVKFNGTYEPGLLNKTKLLLKMKHLSKTERKENLRNAYQFGESSKKVPGILILDDILTTGSTLLSIVEAIRDKLSETTIILFTMAYTDYQEHPNEAINLAGNAYAWQKDNGWIIAAEDTELYNPSIELLKNAILTDSF